jgi:TPR repeat protein/uncharacterized protein YggL (DUF469 family)
MKKSLFLLFMILWISLESGATVYTITKMNLESIQIGTKICVEGSHFEGDELIHWTSDKEFQYIYAQDSNGKTSYFTNFAMKSKSSHTADAYIRQVKMSTRDGVSWLPYKGHNKERFEDKRIALVIGNSNYQYTTNLRNTLHDAQIVAEELQDLGFDVRCMFDVTTREFQEVALDLFMREVEEEHYSTIFVYYSGHGLQHNNTNWLVPVDVNPSLRADVENKCLDGQYLLNRLNDTKSKRVIVVLDACRSLKTNFTRGAMASSEGLRQMDPTTNTLIAFATRAGEVAQDAMDDDAENGPYATALVNALKKENYSLDEMFQDVKEQVTKATISMQTPIHINGMVNKVYLNGHNLMERRAKTKTPQDIFAEDMEMGVKGDMDAQFRLGMAYEYGLSGCDLNRNKAFQWYALAARQGHSEAANKIGTYFYDKKEYESAVKWFQAAADAGTPRAKHNLAMLLLSDDLDVADFAEGAKLLQKLAEEGYAPAQYDLGICFENGIGVYPYDPEALKWFQKAADNDHVEAQYQTGYFYYKGKGCSTDYVTAVKYLRKAAQSGHSDAQFLLGQCYRYGRGVKPDTQEALEWYLKSANQGNPRARNAVEELMPEKYR